MSTSQPSYYPRSPQSTSNYSISNLSNYSSNVPGIMSQHQHLSYASPVQNSIDTELAVPNISSQRPYQHCIGSS
ncbi:unnamed protein product [Macrosiphum euphorbiae]|uniref:Uncharacterized protein n=1 Tax=Macrosiphum euphorbiae TaxID=13131 RepID=A0AAV0WBJ9_9HEMI|nr:unnamed protein product [Macrosiphum euphorbiae]